MQCHMSFLRTTGTDACVRRISVSAFLPCVCVSVNMRERGDKIKRRIVVTSVTCDCRQ